MKKRLFNFSKQVFSKQVNERPDGRCPRLLLYSSTCFLYFFLFTACGGNDDPAPLLPETTTQQDSLALIKINTGTVQWDRAVPMDNWQGVRIGLINGERRVVYLDLHNSRLSGRISVELNQLTALEYLDLSENGLSDNIPNLSVLKDLQILDLHDNKLSGTLSENITKLTGLTYLSLGGNQFYSEIPAGISSLTKLVVLDLAGQKHSLSEPGFSGNIPVSWSSLDKLQYLYLHKNSLSGPIPNFLTTFSNSVHTMLNDNNLGGNIPEGFGNIGSLEYISMNNNNLTGNVPVDLLLNPNWETWKDNIIHQNGSDLGISGTRASANNIEQKAGFEYQLPDKELFYQNNSDTGIRNI